MMMIVIRRVLDMDPQRHSFEKVASGLQMKRITRFSMILFHLLDKIVSSEFFPRNCQLHVAVCCGRRWKGGENLTQNSAAVSKQILRNFC
jgi:hypothetical protein